MDRVKVKVDIKARETIKPSSPTPQNLKIFKLSLLDQIAPPIYVPRILYYAYNGTKPNLKTQKRINLLKESLSQALTRIYPLAGRVKENLFIECNDEGADFLEAEVNSPLDEILRQPEVDVLDLLLPRDYETQLAVQVNIFSCEGMAIGICMFHRIVDGATFSSFVNMWAAIASRSGAGDSLSARAPIFPGPRLFPQRDISALVPRFDVPKGNCITKRFVFPGSKIASLKEKVVANNAKDGTVLSPTRNELVSALIWPEMRDGGKIRAPN
jgi:shikimate O-hydroxycinnamoyltransferase